MKTPTLLLVLLALLLAWLSTAVFAVEATETAIVTRFSRPLPEVCGQGPHLKLPWPIDDVIRFDKRLLVTSVLSEIACEMGVDEILTTGKAALQMELRDRAQEALDALGSGLGVLSTSIVFVRPPEEAAASFRRVADARSEKAKRVSMAEMAGNRKLSGARGAAELTLRRADSLAEERVKQASGDVERYQTLLRELREAPQVVRRDLYLRQMEKVLARPRLVLFDGELQRALDLTLFHPGKRVQSSLPPGIPPGEPPGVPYLSPGFEDGEPEEAPRSPVAEGDGEPDGGAP